MNAVQHRAGTETSLWEQYRDNFSRHLIGVSRYLQTTMMSRLRQRDGHPELRLGYAPYMLLLADGRGRRLSELANSLDISRQACNQTVNQLEQAGYVQRSIDPRDRRGRRVVLTPQGRRLRRDGSRTLRAVDQTLHAIAGVQAARDAASSLGQLQRSLRLPTASGDTATRYRGIGGHLPLLSDYSAQRLMELTRGKGHPGLKLSFGQVLTLIGPGGGRIQQMAAAHDVSKQAISAIVAELELLGYLRRENDPGGARQILLFFTPRGENLIAASVTSVAELQSEFAAIIGAAAMQRLATTMRRLYHGLRLEQDIFDGGGRGGERDIAALATDLRWELGDSGSRELAKRILAMTSGEARDND